MGKLICKCGQPRTLLLSCGYKDVASIYLEG